MTELIYRKVEPKEIGKILDLAENNLDFPLGNESKILKNWNNIEAVGGFEGERLISLLITDPYNLVRWSTGKRANNSFSSKGRIDIKTATLLKPVLAADFADREYTIFRELMDAYFDNMSYCDEIVLYTMVNSEDKKQRILLEEFGFEPDDKISRKMVLQKSWEHFSKKKINRILTQIGNFLYKLGLPFEEVENYLFYTELLIDDYTVVIYILVDEYERGHNKIKFFSYLAAPPVINREVVRYLLELNFHSSYGSFCVDPEGNILIINTKLGPSIDERDIEIFLKSSAMAIIKYTEEIISIFGGDCLFDCILRQKPEFPRNYRYLLEEI